MEENILVQNEKSKIVNAALYIDALKSSGYKSTYNAIAEIVDNSIDADATDIFIIGEQNAPGNGEKRIVSFAFLDNGKGMDFNTLKGCLTIGFTTNQERKGMGRFGVGLPQASIFVCDRVEVYSWQGGVQNCQKVYLDADEVRRNNLNEISDPIPAEIPEKYQTYIHWDGSNKSFDFSEHGTLVIWTKCTAVDHKKWNTCVNHMSEDLGRKYRYFLANNSKSITMIELVSSKEESLLPNDPLYLMSPSQECVPEDIEKFIEDGYQFGEFNVQTGYTSSLFEPFAPVDGSSGVVELPIEFEEGDQKKNGIATIKYSVVKKKYYSKACLKTTKKPGLLPFGKSSRLQNNVGISIVRNGREIDFGSFGFFSYYNVPEYRWWGIEISFNSDLDYAFGISNNKQSVNLKPMSKEEMAETSHDDLKTVWHQLFEEIYPTIKAMDDRRSAIADEKPTADVKDPEQSSSISNTVDQEENAQLESENTQSQEEKEVEAKEQYAREGIDAPTKEQIEQLIDSQVRVTSVHNKGSMDSFIDYSYAAGTLSIVLNAKHPFYISCVKGVFENDDTKTAFELFFIAVIKSIKKQTATNPNAMSALLYEINRRITEYMLEFSAQNE